MPLLVPLHSIILRRGSKRVIPDVGKAFEFTKEEADQIAPTAVRAASGADPKGGFRLAQSGAAVVGATRRRQEREAEAIGKGVVKAMEAHAEAVRKAALEGREPPPEPAVLARTGASAAPLADEDGGL